MRSCCRTFHNTNLSIVRYQCGRRSYYSYFLIMFTPNYYYYYYYYYYYCCCCCFCCCCCCCCCCCLIYFKKLFEIFLQLHLSLTSTYLQCDRETDNVSPESSAGCNEIPCEPNSESLFSFLPRPSSTVPHILCEEDSLAPSPPQPSTSQSVCPQVCLLSLLLFSSW